MQPKNPLDLVESGGIAEDAAVGCGYIQFASHTRMVSAFDGHNSVGLSQAYGATAIADDRVQRDTLADSQASDGIQERLGWVKQVDAGGHSAADSVVQDIGVVAPELLVGRL